MPSSIKSTNFTLVNRLVLLATFIILLLFCYDLYFTERGIQKRLHKINHPQENYYSEGRNIMPLSYYEEEIARRNIFKKDLSERISDKAVMAGPAFKEIVKDFRLIGIVKGDNPQVIIEDVKSGKTYFLYPGDYLGEIKIEEIYADKAVLEFKEERINLCL